MLTQLRVLRMARGIKMREMAHKVGVDESTLSKIEQGKLCAGEELVNRIVAALGYKRRDIFNRDGSARPFRPRAKAVAR